MAVPKMRQQVSGQLLARVGITVQQKYRIHRLLGVGGMAAVYAATHRNGHRVAIKFLLEPDSKDPSIRHLFDREAYVANQVEHPGVVPVLDDDVDEEGCPFLIMPLLEGETLRARWERANRRLSLVEVGVVMSDTLDVLASAHAKGIVHRDIKPENLFITTRGEVRVLDFGIARRTEIDGSATLTGRMFGTPAFMPPEQALNNRASVGPPSDCWAAGATIFTLLSGHFVHEAQNGAALLVAAATRPARSLADVASTLPAPIIGLVDRALAMAPGARWPSAREMREALISTFEEVLGKPLPSVARRIRAEIARELSTEEDSRASKTSSSEPSQENLQVVEKLHGRSTKPGISVSSDAAHILSHGANDDPTTPPEASTTSSLHSRRRNIPIGAVAALAVASIALTFAVATSVSQGTTSGAALASVPSDVNANTPHNPELATPKSAALSAFNAGVQLWLDMSHWEAQDRFEEAASLDPAFARAHLYFVLVVPWVTDATRLHYRNALDYRASLSDDDSQLLEALGPSMQDPPNLAETEHRLTTLLASTRNPLLVSAVASRRLRLDRPQDALEVSSLIGSQTASPASESYIRAAVAIAESRTSDAQEALRDCLARSPSSASCLRNLTVLQLNEGACAEAEASGRQWIAAWPNSADAYKWFAAALYGHTHSIESARAALERKWTLTREEDREITRVSDMTNLSLLAGNIADARRHLDHWERLVSSSPDAFARGWPASVRLDLEYDASPTEKVTAMARHYLEQSAAWTTSARLDFRVSAARTLIRTGGITEEQAQHERDTWMATDTSGFYASNARRWFNFYAELAVTPRLAKEAVRQLPKERPFFDPFMCDNYCELRIGEALFASTNVRESLPHLQRAANACDIESPIDSLRAHYLLGQAMESLNNSTLACDSYRQMAIQWSNATESRLMKEATRRMTHLQCSTNVKNSK